MKLIFVTVLALFPLLLYWGWKVTSRSAYETAEYTVLEASYPFELREYPDLHLASTSMQSQTQGNDGSFMRLFRYISGANKQAQEIAMTTPVFMDLGTPEHKGQMGFVIPKNLAEKHVPEPTSDQVQIRKRSGGQFAVIRFAGRLDRGAVVSAEKQLRAWMNHKGLSGESDPEIAGYDPPWTPGPLRRNEILIRLK